MEALACPAGTPGRSGTHWNVRDFCSWCAAAHSDGQFLTDWEASLDGCQQPDLATLHGFHMTPPAARPISRLMPVFSRAKMAHFGDILLPLSYSDSQDDVADSVRDFYARDDSIYWRGAVGARAAAYQALRGDHRHRLLHLVHNASAADEVTMLLPTRSSKDVFAYEAVSAAAASRVLPLDVGLADFSGCMGADCGVLEREFGGGRPRSALALDHRYVLLLDSETGPAPELLRTLRSGSVAVVSSAFRQWHTERLMAWLHFVPVDVRWQGLHSTMAYFIGLRGRGKLGGRGDVELEGRTEDARWIAEQGRAWARRALRREDMEVYLFRLVLEWARVVDDRRGEMGFKLPG